MERRTFIHAIGSATLAFHLMRCDSGTADTATLSLPVVLSHCVDAETIRGIGEAYRAKSSENSDRKLQKLLTDDRDDFKDASELRAFLESKIESEFQKKDVQIISGWILSTTECRQCALYSFQNT